MESTEQRNSILSKIIKRTSVIEKNQVSEKTPEMIKRGSEKKSFPNKSNDSVKQLNELQQKRTNSNSAQKYSLLQRVTAIPVEKEKYDCIDNYRLRLDRKIGNGNFGELYKGQNKETNEPVAIKIEKRNSGSASLLSHEYEFYKRLGEHEGIPKIYCYGQIILEKKDKNILSNALVMEMLGQNLEELFEKCQHKFSVKTVCMIAIEVIRLIQYVHSKYLIYRDIKPENFMIDVDPASTNNKTKHTIHIIDFGLAKEYMNPETKEHIVEKHGKELTGTARYMSINTHRGKEQSRRDDLEALGHMLFYFLRGTLPWQGLKADTNKEKYKKIGEVKSETPIDILGYGYPKIFEDYLEYCRKLEFQEEPNYKQWIEKFEDYMKAHGMINDGKFDWVVKERQSNSKRSSNDSQRKSLDGGEICEIRNLKLKENIKDAYNDALKNFGPLNVNTNNNKISLLNNSKNKNSNNNNNNNTNMICVDNLQSMIRKEPTFCKILKDKFRTKFSSNQNKNKISNVTTVNNTNERIAIISTACNQSYNNGNKNNSNNSFNIDSNKNYNNNNNSTRYLVRNSYRKNGLKNQFNSQSSSTFCYNFCFADNNTSSSLYGNFDKLNKNSS